VEAENLLQEDVVVVSLAVTTLGELSLTLSLLLLEYVKLLDQQLL
jgi:hypothetical protein